MSYIGNLFFGLFDNADDLKPKATYLPTHLNSPLKPYVIQQALGFRKGKGWKSVAKQWQDLQEIFKLPLPHHTDHTKVLVDLQDYGQNFLKLNQGTKGLYLQDFKIGLNNLNIQKTASFKLSGMTKEPWGMNWKTEGWSLVAQFSHLRAVLEEAVQYTAAIPLEQPSMPLQYWKEKHGFITTKLDRKFQMYCSKSLCYITTGMYHTLLDRDGLLMLSDIISQRTILMATAETGQQWHMDQYLNQAQLFKIFRWGDQILKSLGNSGYELIGQWEALLTGHLQSSTQDPICDKDLFLVESQLAFTHNDMMWSGEDLALLEIQDLISSFNGNSHLFSQAHGLFRIWGHPVVDELLGIAKLKKTACRRKVICQNTVGNVTCHFKELFCLNYRKKHGVWPNIDISELEPENQIKLAFEENRALEIKHPKYDFTDWILVDGLPTFAVDPSYDLSTMISDKALSLVKSELESSIKKGTIGDPHTRRVMIQWMQSKLNNPMELLQDINDNGFGEEDGVVGVSPKEREMKLEPRLFSLLTLKKRMYVVVTEALLADKVLPLFPEITMKDDLITLQKKMYNNTEPMKNPSYKPGSYVTIMSNMDFEKWNSNMRRQATEPLFKFLDQLFGYQNVFGRTHDMFEKALLYLADGYNLPQLDKQGKLKVGPSVWANHLGGLEGLRQKGWTLFTVAILSLTTRKTNAQFRIMAAGDNVIISLRYKIGEDGIGPIRHLHNVILIGWNDTLGKIGLPLKASETWSSSVLFAYGKVFILKGAVLSMSMKKICRMFRLANEGYPTLESSISSISANVSSAIFSDLSPDISFFIGSSEISGCFRMHMRWSLVSGKSLIDQWKTKSTYRVPLSSGSLAELGKGFTREYKNNILGDINSLISGLLLFPKCLGGYPIPLYSNFLARSFPDNVSESLSQLKLVYHTTPSLRLKFFIKNICSPILNPEVTPSHLIQDPIGLNLATPASPEGILKIAVLKFLDAAQWITNEQFKTFYTLARKNQDHLIDLLYTMAPFHPRVASEIFKSTLEGYANQLMGRIQKTSTLVKWATEEGSMNILTQIGHRELDYFKSALNGILTPGDVVWNSSLCSREHADNLRTTGWQKPEGMMGVTVPHPMEYLTGYHVTMNRCPQCSSVDDDGSGYFLIKLSNDFYENKSVPWRLQLGENHPFMGGKTQDKSFLAAYLRESIHEPLIKKAIACQRIVGWIAPSESNLAQLLNLILSSMTDIPAHLFRPPPGTVTGSSDHRFADEATKHGGTLPHIYSPASYLHLSSSNFRDWSKGSQNVTVHFQVLMISCQSSVIYDLFPRYSQEDPIYSVHAHRDCPRCVVPVSEEHPEIPQIPEEFKLTSLPDNPLCFISKEKLKLPIYVPLVPIVQGSNITDWTEAEMCIYPKIALEVVRSITKMDFVSQAGGQKIGETGSLPISWTFRLDAVKLMQATSIALYAHILYYTTRTLTHGEESSLNVLTNVLTKIGLIPSHCFSILGQFISNPQTRHDLATSIHLFPVPSSIPMEPGSVSKAIKEGIVNILHDMLQGLLDCPQIWTGPVVYLFPDATLSRHPVFCRLIERMFFDNSESIESYLHQFEAFRNSFRLLPVECDISQQDPTGLTKWMMNSPQMPQLPIRTIQGLKMLHENLKTSKFIRQEETSDFLSRLISPSLKIPQSIINLPNSRLTLPGHRTIMPPIGPRELDTNSEWNLIATPPERTSLSSKHCIRFDCNNTTAGTKWYPILEQIGFQVRNATSIAMLGDGTGGISFLLTRLNSRAKIYFNTYISTVKIVPHSLTQTTPCAFDHAPEQISHLYPLSETLEGPTDLTQTHTITRILNLHPEGFDVVCCDAEGEGPDKPMKAIKLALAISRLMKPGHDSACIMKTYSSNAHLLLTLVGVLSVRFKKVSIEASSLTSVRSTEVFIIGRDAYEKPYGNFSAQVRSPTLITCSGNRPHQQIWADANTFKNRALEFSYEFHPEIGLEIAERIRTPWTIQYGLKAIRMFYPSIGTGKRVFPEFYFAESGHILIPVRFKQIGRPKRRYQQVTFNQMTLKRLVGMILAWEIGLTLKQNATPIIIEDQLDKLDFVAWRCRKGGWRSCITWAQSLPIPRKGQKWIRKSLSDIVIKNDLKRIYFVGGLLAYYYPEVLGPDHAHDPWDWTFRVNNLSSNFRFLTSTDDPYDSNLSNFFNPVGYDLPTTRDHQAIDVLSIEEYLDIHYLSCFEIDQLTILQQEEMDNFFSNPFT